MSKNKITIHLQIDEDYIDTFMLTLPKEHITVIEENFKENKRLLEDELLFYINKEKKFIPYAQSIDNISLWFKEHERENR